jgi:NADH-quinone oxidoreductase subunit M
MIYERYHTREIADLGGLARRLPLLSFFFVLFTLSSIGLPGLNGFAGEFLLLTGSFQRAWSGAPEALGSQLLWIAVLSTFGVVLGAWYMLDLVQRVFFGPLREPIHDHSAASRHSSVPPHSHAGHSDHGHGGDTPLPPGPADMKPREILAVAPLVVFVFWIGLYPKFFLDYLAPAVDPIGKTVAEHVYAQYGPPQQRVDAKPLSAGASLESSTEERP